MSEKARPKAQGQATFLPRVERAQRAVLLGVTFLFPLLMLPGVTLDEFKLPKMALLLVGVGVAGGLKMASWALGGGPLRWKLLAIPVASLMVPLTLSWLASPYRHWALWGLHLRYQGLIPYALFALYGLLMADAFTGRQRSVAWALGGAGAVAGLYAIVQGFHLDPFFPTAPSGLVSPAAMTIGNPNFSGGFQAMVLPVCLGLFFAEEGRRKETAAGFALLSGIGLAFSFSQGAWLAATVAALAWAGLLLFRSRRRLAYGAVVAALGLALVGPAAVAATLVSPRAATVLGQTVEVRGLGWRTAFGAWQVAPVLGQGPNTLALLAPRHIPIENASMVDSDLLLDEPHSIPVSFLGSTGLLGAVGWFIAVGWILIVAIRRAGATRSPIWLAAAAGLIAYASQSLVSIDDPTLRLTLWALAAIAVAPKEQGPPDPPLHPSLPLGGVIRLGGLIGGTILIVAASFFGTRTLAADIEARTGDEAALNNDPANSTRAFERAIAYRDDAAYRALAARRIGELATRRGAAGRDLFREMRGYFASIRHLQFPHSLLREGLLTHTWAARVDQSFQQESVRLVLQAHESYPASVDMAIGASDILIDVRRGAEAVAILRPYAAYSPPFARYWGALALANAHIGDRDAAESAIERALLMDERDSRALEAMEMLNRI